MAGDVTIFDLLTAMRATWTACGSAVTDLIPTASVWYQRAPSGTAFPFVTTDLADVSAYFGGTEYFSGRKYIKKSKAVITIHGQRSQVTAALVKAVNNALGWGSTSPAAVWTVTDATVLAAMPEVEKTTVVEERQDGDDLIEYETSFTLTLEADRGT